VTSADISDISRHRQYKPVSATSAGIRNNSPAGHQRQHPTSATTADISDNSQHQLAMRDESREPASAMI
jgi:hypothetical protein